MSEMERQLRDLLEVTAGEPPRPVTVQSVRRRVVRRRVAEGATAAAAVALVAGLGVAVAAQVAGPRAAAEAAARAGVPRYYIQQGGGGGYYPQANVVRATATGAVTGTVRCPWPKSHIAPGGITPASHRTFFIVCQQSTGRAEEPAVTGSRIYRLQLTSSGRAAGYALVPGGTLPGINASRAAATPDGTEIAVAAGPAGAETGQAGEGPWASSIFVINTRTGARAVWHNIPGTPGAARYGIADLSLTADGRELVFYTRVRCVSGGSSHTCVPQAQEVRAVSPAAHGGQLSSSRPLLAGAELDGVNWGSIEDAFITPDGSGITLFTDHTGATSETLSVLRVSVSSGAVRTLYQVSHSDGFSFQFFSADPSGQHLLLDAGGGYSQDNGWIDRGQLIKLQPSGDQAYYESW